MRAIGICEANFVSWRQITNVFVQPANDLLIGDPGLAGLVVLLLTDARLLCYDRFVSRENFFRKAVWACHPASSNSLSHLS